MHTKTTFIAALAITLCIAVPARAQAPLGGEYTVGNPMPSSMMGIMYTDRPMRTLSPYTVAPGHLQLETYALSYLWNENSLERERLGIGNTLFRAGLARDLEASITIEPLIWEWLDNGTDRDEFGLGDTEVRLKYHLYGPNYPRSRLPVGESAVAISPFFTLPTGTDDFGLDHMSFGVDLPIYINLEGMFFFGLTPSVAYIPEGDVFADEDDEYLRLSNALALFLPFHPSMTAFAEFFARVNTEEWSDWEGSMDIGLMYGLTPDIH
ncbi:MAG: transporter, partial [Desulfomonilia bacterium]